MSGYDWKPFARKDYRPQFRCDVCSMKRRAPSHDLPAGWSQAVVFAVVRFYCPACTAKADGAVGR